MCININMPGGLLQLSSYGSNDLFLTGTPQITFFKVVYRRYTNFSCESIRVNFDDNVNFNKEVSIVVPKIGDLMHKIYIEIDLPEITINRTLPQQQYQSIYTESLNNYKIVEKFMKINIDGYRNGYEQLRAVNTTVVDIISSVENSFDIDNYSTNTKNDFISLLNNTDFIFSNISMYDAVGKLKDNNGDILPFTTKYNVQTVLDNSLNECMKVNDYYLNLLKKYKKLSEDENNNIAKCRWINRIGHYIIEYVSILIGGIEIDKQYGEWLNIWYELSGNKNMESIYFKMIGNVDELVNYKRETKKSYKLYIPLQFWFCRHNGLAFPLIALQYHDVSFLLKFRKFSECFYYKELSEDVIKDDILRKKKLNDLNLPDLDNFLEYSKKTLSASLLIDYIYLDKNERRRFAQSSHEYLIEQLQINEFDNIKNTQLNVVLNFMHPCKELVWVVQNKKYVEVIDGNNELTWDNYCDIVNNKNINPVEYCSLEFNGKTRVQHLNSMYFDTVQPYKHHSNISQLGINVYSFSLNPEEHQPSGSANLGRIPKNILKLNFNETLVEESYSIRVYAVNYNILRFISGMAGLAFTIG